MRFTRKLRHGSVAAALGLALLPFVSACGSPGGLAQVGATPTAPAAATAIAPTPTDIAPATPEGSATPAEAAATPAAAPTPADPYSVLNPLAFYDPSNGSVLVKEDLIDLDGKEPKEALLTISVPPVFTATNIAPFATLLYTNTLSGLAVVQYDASAAQWKLIAQTDTHAAPGIAAPLPGAAQGQNLQHMQPPLPVLQLRTAFTPTVGSSVPAIALHLFGWQDGKATPLHMRPAGATSDVDAVFTGAVDAQLLDIDNDGVAEVIVDDAGKTTIWKWDGARFTPR